MAATNVGTITYTVDANTSKLLSASKEAEGFLDKLGQRFSKTDTAAKGAQMQMTQTAAAVRQLSTEATAAAAPMDNINRMLGAYVSLQGAKSVIELADAYTSLQNRLRLVTTGQQELQQATSDVFSIAQNSSQEIGVVAQVYQRFAQNAKSLGLNLGQVADVTDTVSKAVAISGASSASAEAALTQFGQALASGTLRGEELNSVMEQTPALAKAIADGMGLTVGELRKVAAEGEITSAVLIEALGKAAGSVEAQFASRVKTVSQSFVELKNAMVIFAGESTAVGGATSALSKALGVVTANLEAFVNVLTIAGAGALARFVAGQGLALAASVRAALAARAEAAEQLQLASAQVAATAAAVAHAAAQTGLTVATGAATLASNAHSAALIAEAGAQKAAQLAGVGVLGVLGGPVGIIALLASAAAAAYMFGNSTAAAAPQVDQLTASVEKLSSAQLALRKQQASEGIDKLKAKAIEATGAVKALEKDYSSLEEAFKSGRGGVTAQGLENVKKSLVEARAESDTTVKSLQEMYNAFDKISEAEKSRSSGGMKATPQQQADPEVAKRLAGMREEVELAKLTGEARARLQAIQKLGKKATQEEREEAERLASQIFKLEEARKGSTKAIQAGESAAKKAAAERKKEAAEIAKLQEEDAKTLRELGKQIMLAQLQGKELAEVQAVLSLGKYATPEQIEDARLLGAMLFEVNKQKALVDKVGEDPVGYARGKEEPMTGGAFDEQTARYEAEKTKENERYADQLKRLEEARLARADLNATFDLEEQAMAQQHADRLQQIEDAKQKVMLAAGEKGFGAAADGLKAAFGEQNALYKIAFAAQKAFAIAQSIIAIQQGIALAAANPWPANLGAMASVAAATASIIGSISSVTMGGGRLYGGDVAPDKAYRINENGAPEVFNSANGQQYMLPNSRGEVVSNKDATSASGMAQPKITINMIENKERAGSVDQQQGDDGETVINIVVADVFGGGKAANAFEQTYGLTRTGH